MAGPGGTEVGRVSVKVVPDTDGFRDKVKKEIQEVEKLKATITLELDLTKFHAQVEEAKAALKSISDETIKITVDEESVKNFSKITEELKKTGQEAENAGKKLKETLDGDNEKSASKLAGFFSSIAKFGGEAATQVGKLGSEMGGKLADGLKSVGGSLVSMIAQLVIWIPLLSLAAGGILFLVGAVGAAAAGLPVLLTALGAPIAAVILGFDGIKKAAQQLSPEVDKLKKRLSDTFAKQLTPVFKQLKTLFPIISDGLNGAAIGVSKLIDGLVRLVTSSKNVELLKNAFQGVQIFLKEMAPGVEALIQSLLNVAGVTDFYRILGETISDVSSKLKGLFDQSLADGSLAKGLENLRTLLVSLTGMFSSLLRNAIKFFNGATPGVTKFFDALSSFFLKIDWERLGKAFGSIFDKLAGAINQIPAETIEQITSGFERLGGVIGDLLSGKSFDVLIAAFTAFLDIVTLVLGAIDWLLEAFASLGDWIANIPENLSKLGDAFSNLMTAWAQGFRTKFEEFGQWVKGIPQAISDYFVGSEGILNPRGNAIFEGLRAGAAAKWDEFVAWIKSIPQKIIDFFAAAGDWLLDAGKWIFVGLGKGTAQEWDNLTAWFRRIPDLVKGLFSGAGDWLKDAGIKIIQGLLNGINSMIPSISGALRGLTASLPFWKGPPQKDKTLLTANGVLIMQGLLNGLKSGFDPVESLLGDMTTAIGGAFNDPSLIKDMTVSGEDISAAGTSQLEVSGGVTGMNEAVATALSGWTVQLDATGLARLVNKGNNAVSRRS